MRKVIKKGAFALAMLLCFTHLIGCGGGETPNAPIEPTPEGGEHGGVVETTENMIVDNGSSAYKIVLPANADEKTVKAASEFDLFFREATDIKLEVITDDQAVWSDSAKYISLGNTSLLDDAQIELDAVELGTQGYEIHTVDQSVFVASVGGYGTLYGTYDLLKYLVGYEQFTANYYSLDTNVTEIALPDFDIKEIPDFEYRIAPYGSAFYNSVFRERMRTFHDEEIYIAGAQVHTMLRSILPTKTYVQKLKDQYDNGTLELDYEVAHPYWFMDSKQQLCYTAHGKPDEYAALIDEIVKNCKELILADPNHDYISLTQMDVNVWCSCDACSKLKNKYGTNAASQIILTNDVAERIENWLNEEQGGRKVQFVVFAYHQTEKAPTTRNSDGTYSAIDNEVVLRDNVSVQIAPIAADYITSIYDEDNITLYNTTESWLPCAKSFAYWGYDCYFNSYLTPYNTYGSLQDGMRRLYDMNARIVWMQGAWNLKALTGFDDVKMYLLSKLMWNVNVDVNALIQNFFDNVYQEASEDMYNAFLQMRIEMELQKSKDLGNGIWAQPTTSTDWWGKRTLVQMLETFETAKTKIESYKVSNPDLYQTIMDNITKESIFPRYVLIETYGSTYSNVELAEMKKSFRNDVERLNIDKLREGASMIDYFNANGY